MAKKRTYEIWDNHWKDAPTWSFLLLLVAVLAIMALSFQGGLMLMKGSFLFAGIASGLIGLGLYFLVYKTIQLRTSADNGSNNRGMLVASLLLVPYLGFVLLGGAALCNELGFRKAQQTEFEALASKASFALSQLETNYRTASSAVQTELQKRCKNCGTLPSAGARNTEADEIATCFEIASTQATRCNSPVLDPSVLNELEDELDERFKAKPVAHLAIESFLFRAQDASFSSRLFQYQVQRQAGELDSLFGELQAHHQHTIGAFTCVTGLSDPPVLDPMPSIAMDCSNYRAVFCSGWGWQVCVVLLVLMLACLVPLGLADYTEVYVDNPDGEDPGDLTIKL